MTEDDITHYYALIKAYHEKYLKDSGVILPKLKVKEKFTKDALVLIYLVQDYPNTKIVSKKELTTFIRIYDSNINDVQQARHLAAQNGWYILSGTRNDLASMKLKKGEYKLVSLEKAYPNFNKERRCETEGDDYFENLKQIYDYRCATCGSKEGEPNFMWKNTITVLQKGHMDPNKPLEPGNIIPQCDKCNRADRNYWIFDAKGRVIKIANAKVVDRCSKKVKEEIYERLKIQLKK